MMHLPHRSPAAARNHCTRTLFLAPLCLGLAAVLTACGSGSHPVSQESAPSTAALAPSASPSADTNAAAKTAVLAAYQGYWDTQVQIYSQGSLVGVPIDKYAIGNADALIRQGLQYYVQQNLVTRGRPNLSPQVASLNLTTKPFTATVTDCVDTTNFFPVDKDTGKPAKLTSTVHRHPGTYSASFDNVQWRITDGSIDRTKTC